MQPAARRLSKKPDSSQARLLQEQIELLVPGEVQPHQQQLKPQSLSKSPSLTKHSQQRFIKLVEDGVEEHVALKITSQGPQSSEIIHKLDKMIEGINKYRHDYQSNRSPKFQAKKPSIFGQRQFNQSNMQYNDGSQLGYDTIVSQNRQERKQRKLANMRLTSIRQDSDENNEGRTPAHRNSSKVFSGSVLNDKKKSEYNDQLLFSAYGDNMKDIRNNPSQTIYTQNLDEIQENEASRVKIRSHSSKERSRSKESSKNHTKNAFMPKKSNSKLKIRNQELKDHIISQKKLGYQKRQLRNANKDIPILSLRNSTEREKYHHIEQKYILKGNEISQKNKMVLQTIDTKAESIIHNLREQQHKIANSKIPKLYKALYLQHPNDFKEVSPSHSPAKEFKHLIYLRNKRGSMYDSRQKERKNSILGKELMYHQRQRVYEQQVNFAVQLTQAKVKTQIQSHRSSTDRLGVRFI